MPWSYTFPRRTTALFEATDIGKVFMSHRLNIEAVDLTLHDIGQNGFTVGVVAIIFSGEIHQILPVVPAALQ